MKIVVLNGSPKGNMSVTLQFVPFIRKKSLAIERSSVCVALSMPLSTTRTNFANAFSI
jgi:hypothetical protein